MRLQCFVRRQICLIYVTVIYPLLCMKFYCIIVVVLGEEGGAGGVSSSVAGETAGAPEGEAGTEGEGAVSSSQPPNGAPPLPPADAAHALATLASAALHHHEQVYKFNNNGLIF